MIGKQLICRAPQTLLAQRSASWLGSVRFKSGSDQVPPPFSAPAPQPLGDKAAQKEMEDMIRQAAKKAAQESHLQHPDALQKTGQDDWQGDKNPVTGEIGGPKGKEPTRYGDWERKGRVYDF
ncbi:hypothetical protein DFS34DRAFT_397994 [Phlyctochytrium arcticum]|nr:hypothetical protein DFS34DRAFT_397994 [Phlyctochytrium arcticum]